MAAETPPTLTILTAPADKPQCKTFRPGGADDPALGYLFRWREEPIDGFDAMARVLDALQAQPCDVAILGRVRDDARDRRKVLRRKYDRVENGKTVPHTIEDAGSRLLHLDLDDLELPADADWRDPAALAAWTWAQVGVRFAPLRDVSCWWQASGSAGTAGKRHLAKFHFWIMCDTPMIEAQRRDVLIAAGADDDVGCPIQKNYTAPPRFAGVPDPLAGAPRSGVIRGTRDQMDTSAALRAAPIVKRAGGTHAAGRSVAPGQAVQMPDEAWLAATSTTPQGAEMLADAVAKIKAAEKRNNTIFAQAARIGGAIRDRLIGYADAVEKLVEAAEETGTSRPEEAVANGLRRGLETETAKEKAARLGAKLGKVETVSQVDQETLLDQARRAKPAPLPDRDRRTLMRALRGAGGDKIDLPVLIAAVLGIGRGVPSRLGLDDLREIITENAPGVSPALRDALVARVQWGVARREIEALRPVTISDSRRKGDGIFHEYVDRLVAPSLRGVTIVRAPLGSGKTQRAAAPWVAAAKAAGGRVVAICHRRSLVSELSRRLSLAHYEDAGAWIDMEEKGGLAICSPSLTAQQWRALPARWVVIDEIGQVLRFLRARDHCRTRDGTARDVWQRLVDLIRNADGVIVLDGQVDDRVVDFIQQCRPDEGIQIVEMPERDTGIEADMLVGNDADADAMARAARIMAGGGKVWISCEGKEKTEAAGAFLERFGRVLTITADTKLSRAQSAFLDDPEGQSRLYDAVIASPVISSGLSIEHAGDPHFTEGFFIGAGTVLTPADAVQMMRRVRYLRRFTIALSISNFSTGHDAKRMLDGAEQAAEDEGAPASRSRFDRLVAGYAAADANSRGDFANNLWHQLTAQGWTLRRQGVERGQGAEAKEITAEAREARRTARAEAIMQACMLLPMMPAEEIDTIRRAGAQGDDRFLVEAWQGTLALGKATLTADDVAFLDDGGVGKLDLFDDLDGHGASVMDRRDQGQALVHRRLRVARAKHLREIFDGFDVLGDRPWLDKDSARTILARIMRRADAFVASGAVPPRFGARFGSDAPAMPRDPVKAVVEIMARAGVQMVARQVRERAPDAENQPEVSQIPPYVVSSDGGICDTPTITEGRNRAPRRRVYVACQDSVQAMRARADQRRSAADLDGHPAHIHAAKQLIALLDRVGVREISTGRADLDAINSDLGREIARRATVRPMLDHLSRARPDILIHAPP